MRSPYGRGAVLTGLARNPALPRELRLRLAAGAAAAGLLAARPDLDEELASAIAAHGCVTALRALIANPALPRTVLERLRDHPDPGVRRKALAAGADGRASPIAELPVNEREWAARFEPVHVRYELARDPEPSVRAAVAAAWPDVPGDLWRELLTDPDPRVRAAALPRTGRAALREPPEDLRAALLTDPATRAGAARHVPLDEATARELADDPDEEVRIALVTNPSTPGHVVEMLADDEPLVLAALFARGDIGAEVRAKIHATLVAEDALFAEARDQWLDTTPPRRPIGESGSERSTMAMVALLALSMEPLPWVLDGPREHAHSPYPSVRRALAAHADRLDADLVAALLADPVSEVRAAAAAALPHLDPDTLERLDRAHVDDVKRGARPADVHPFPPEYLRRFATDPAARMRRLAPRDPDLPPDIAEGLATDPDAEVRRLVADHPNQTPDAVLMLLQDDVVHVAEAAAASPVLPPRIMYEIVGAADL